MDVSLLDDSLVSEADSTTGGEAFTNGSRNKNLSLMMPVKVRTTRDYEQQLHELRKENFQLKVQLFYIRQEKGGHASNGVEFETLRQHFQRDLETVVKEIDKRNALIQKNWVTIKEQHEAIEDINEEKLAIEKELVTLKTKMSLAEAACKEDTKMADVISEMEKQNEQLEQGMKALRQRLTDLEEHELQDLRSQVDKRNHTINCLTARLCLREETVRSLESQIASKKSTPAPLPTSTLKGQLDSLEAVIQAKEAVIEGLNKEVSQLKSSMRLSKDRCHGLEDEIERAAQVHASVCFEKGNRLESLLKRLEELEENVQESQTVKSRYTALERECSSLRDTIRENAGFIEELLAERDKAALETEKLFHGLVHSMKQKDEHIEQLRAQLNSPGAQGSTHIHVLDFLTVRRGNKSLPIHANASSLQDPSHSRSHHTSPDLGIDSDPMPEREDVDSSAAGGGGFEEHWQHRMGGNWSVTSVHSAPEAVGGACPLCMQKGASDTSGKNKLNWTFAGEAVDYPLDDCSPSKNVECPTLSTNSVRLCAVVQLVDHELLKKRVDESICLVRRLEGTVQQLLDVLLQLVPEFDEAPDSKQLLQEALSGCHSIKVCLVESFKLICSFTISPMQGTKDECRQRCCYENKQLKDELTSLQKKYAQRGIELQSAIEQISTFRQKKEGMEREISRQLSKAKMVLKQTRGTLNVLRSRDPKPNKK